MYIYLATWLFEKSHKKSLDNKKSRRRLLSYYHTKQRPVSEFKEYVK